VNLRSNYILIGILTLVATGVSVLADSVEAEIKSG
jgi:hypothetical protein